MIPEKKIIIELDGDQHFRQVSNWQSPEEVHSRDIYKMQCANDNKYRIIRILQPDVFHDKYEWLPQLLHKIKQLGKTRKIKNIFMCKNDEYSIF